MDFPKAPRRASYFRCVVSTAAEMAKLAVDEHILDLTIRLDSAEQFAGVMSDLYDACGVELPNRNRLTRSLENEIHAAELLWLRLSGFAEYLLGCLDDQGGRLSGIPDNIIDPVSAYLRPAAEHLADALIEDDGATREFMREAGLPVASLPSRSELIRHYLKG